EMSGGNANVNQNVQQDVEREGGAANNNNNNQQNLENWLPVSASRKAKWWYSTFHNVTAMVGAGVLSLPYALSQLGWIPGISVILVSWLVTFYSLWQLVQMHELVPGKRFDRYFDLGEHVLKGKVGYWIIMIQQLIVQLLLSQIPNFNTLKGISLLAAFMSVCYSVVACATSIAKGIEHHPTHYGVRSHTTAGKTFDVFNALGTIAFAFAGHSVVLEIQATLPSTEEKPSKIPMWRGVVVAYTIVILCYLTVAISGYWAFGDLVEDDVLISLERPEWVIAVANFMVFLHVLGSYQVFAMPVFDTIESCLVQKFKFNPSSMLRLVARSIYVAVVGFLAVTFPFFGGLLGFFGGLAFSATSYIIPCVLWLYAKKPKMCSFHWIASVTCIAIGVTIAVVAPVGGIRTIIVSAQTYKFYSR
ncbi:lysine/histidine transporter 1-like protein, partial [Trifolium pratense]